MEAECFYYNGENYSTIIVTVSHHKLVIVAIGLQCHKLVIVAIGASSPIRIVFLSQ
jgi:hypothetical protein